MCIKAKTNSHFDVNPDEMLKEATIHLCLFDESHFSNISTIQIVTLECIKTRSATCCNNRNDLLHLSFTIFGGLYIANLNIYDEAFIVRIVSR